MFLVDESEKDVLKKTGLMNRPNVEGGGTDANNNNNLNANSVLLYYNALNPI